MNLVHGFELLREREIKELNTLAKVYRHVKSGAQLLSLENNDENKVFGVTFRTPPKDSTGIAHIMEHSVLCGSRKYPLKEPFVELKKGSLNTFLNAFTFPDKTCYPIASQNVQDFYNLIDVYLDAVFYPNISPLTLQQEGWHYELESVDQPLRYKGVVFNEMKGAYSSPETLLGRRSRQTLFPDITYGLDSGGDPEVIPDLTYEQFKIFHKTYYHPSNAYIYFYGDDDPKNRLEILDGYLRDFEAIQIPSGVPLQTQFDRSKEFVLPYDVTETGERKKAFITVNWLLPENDDVELGLSLRLLAHILVGTSAAPLRKALIDSGLGEGLSGGGMDGALRQMYFTIGMKGVEPENTRKVESLILETLQDLVVKGIDNETIAASLNTIEFNLRENNTGSLPRGLSLMLRALTTWLHDGDPFGPLAFEEVLEAIKDKVQPHERYFEHMIDRYFIKNPHRTTIILEPDPELAKRREARERDRLENALQAMDDRQLEHIVQNVRDLKRHQETPDSPDALASIPSLKLSDLDKTIRKITREVLTDVENVDLLYHDLFTNGIVYLDLAFDLKRVSQKWLPYIPLFNTALLQMGTRELDYVRLSQRIGQHTGGINSHFFTSASQLNGGTIGRLVVRSKATLAKTRDLIDILKDVLLTVNLDNQERFKQLLLETKAGMETAIVPSGHHFVNRRLRGRFNPADWAAEKMGGIEQLFFLRALAERVDDSWSEVLEALTAIRDELLKRENLVCNLTLDQDSWRQIAPQVNELLASIPQETVRQSHWMPDTLADEEGWVAPAQVNYVGKAGNLYDLGYKYNGSTQVVLHYLRSTHLWDKVRVQGGAYGAFSSFDRHSGVLSFLSFRDPNVSATIDAFDGSAAFLRSLEISDSELTKAIIGVIGNLDAYQLPDAKGFSSMYRFFLGTTDEERQQIRDQVLGTSAADFHAFGELLEEFNRNSQIVVLGAEGAIEQANHQLGNRLLIQRIL